MEIDERKFLEELKEKKEKQKKAAEDRRQFQRVAIYTGIPMTLLGGVVMGYFVGSFLEKRYPSNNIILSVCVLLGMGAGFKAVYDFVKKLN